MASATLRRLVFLVLVAGALCAPATAALAQAPASKPPPPGLGVRLLQGPAGSQDDPRAHEYIVDHLAPGTTISRQIGFTNGDAEPVDLSFYAASADIRDGGFVPGAGHAANELTGWTTFSPTSATVAPGQTLPVTVTIAVPPDAVAGERYAAALAESAGPPAAGGGVSSVSRVGIRIYLSVGPGGAAATGFSIDTMTAQRDADGKPFVTAQVHNTGERAIDLSGRLELTGGPAGLSAGPFPVKTVATLAIGGSGSVTVVLDPGLPIGPWDAEDHPRVGQDIRDGHRPPHVPDRERFERSPDHRSHERQREPAHPRRCRHGRLRDRPARCLRLSSSPAAAELTPASPSPSPAVRPDSSDAEPSVPWLAALPWRPRHGGLPVGLV